MDSIWIFFKSIDWESSKELEELTSKTEGKKVKENFKRKGRRSIEAVE